ncbi:MAG: hypothetical protein NWS92_02570 [Crocinitomicaceae bacterium]|nr:hypothetical protein [Crocinitomicaceae bacterium]MDP4724602.1 hypothetical protein [Crocinitomicaceae bacterium]MDP4739035.1 hypothetical protein [Crocinitomicaceae bacterium]MDP4799091.1 hypothetical protein [Crocinitomicaceae bacterium]MDP4807035.1 hypothetical protein [Crocinitomicaceae bacterium]
MKWIGNRISFNDQKDKTTIVIDPSKNVWISAIMGAWLGMWYAIGGTVIWALNVMKLKGQEEMILWIFLVFWLYYAWRVTMSFFWNIRGQEYIRIDADAFYLKKSFLHFGKSVPYYFENIKNLKFEIPKEGSFQALWESSPWINGGERFEFDYFHQKVRFGKKLNEKEAKLLFQLISKKIKS